MRNTPHSAGTVSSATRRTEKVPGDLGPPHLSRAAVPTLPALYHSSQRGPVVRALEADIRVNDSRASRLHARIDTERDDATSEMRYRLVDLDSTNGTILNGKRITQALLRDGDKFEVGDQLIRFEMLDEIDRE